MTDSTGNRDEGVLHVSHTHISLIHSVTYRAFADNPCEEALKNLITKAICSDYVDRMVSFALFCCVHAAGCASSLPGRLSGATPLTGE